MWASPPDIDKSNSSIGTSIYETADVTLPAFRNNTMPSNTNLKVNNNQTKTISAANFLKYKKIEVKKNATLIVDVPELYAKEIKTKDGATIIFNQSTEVMVTKDVKLDKNNTFNNSGEDVYVYIKGKFEVKENSNVHANIYSKKDIKAKGKNNKIIYMTGLFISDSKVIADDYSIWNWNPESCGWSSSSNSSLVIYDENGGNFQQNNLAPETENDELSKLDFKVYPNPANRIVYVDLKQFSGKRVDIVLMDHTGQPVYRQKFDSASDSPYSIDLSNLSKGFYLITVQTEGQDIVVKKLLITNN